MPLPNSDIGFPDGFLEEFLKNKQAVSSEKDLNLKALAERVITLQEEFTIQKSDFEYYQEFVRSMKVYPEKNAIIYPTLGIVGEGGEIAEKVKKWLRGDRELDKFELLKEAGDVMWYITSLVDDLGYTLDDMIRVNMTKLKSRKERGVQKGDGDNR